MANFTNLDDQSKKSTLEKFKSWGRNAISTAQRLFNRLVRSGTFDLRKEIYKGEFYSARNGGALAKDWFLKEVTKNPGWMQHRQYMEQGKLYFFAYDHPKYADVLDWYDRRPLVLSLGNYVSKDGQLVEMGINLHMLPLQVRILVLTTVFDAFSKRYKGEMYRTNQSSVPMRWQQVGGLVKKFGADFAFRSYLPKLRTQIVEFPYEVWSKAVFINSDAYEKMTAQQIYAQYIKHLRDNGIVFTGMTDSQY